MKLNRQQVAALNGFSRKTQRPQGFSPGLQGKGFGTLGREVPDPSVTLVMCLSCVLFQCYGCCSMFCIECCLCCVMFHCCGCGQIPCSESVLRPSCVLCVSVLWSDSFLLWLLLYVCWCCGCVSVLCLSCVLCMSVSFVVRFLSFVVLVVW